MKRLSLFLLITFVFSLFFQMVSVEAASFSSSSKYKKPSYRSSFSSQFKRKPQKPVLIPSVSSSSIPSSQIASGSSSAITLSAPMFYTKNHPAYAGNFFHEVSESEYQVIADQGLLYIDVMYSVPTYELNNVATLKVQYTNVQNPSETFSETSFSSGPVHEVKLPVGKYKVKWQATFDAQNMKSPVYEKLISVQPTPSVSTSQNPLCRGMTWKVKDSLRNSHTVLVGSYEKTNPYEGDTGCVRELPVLCFYRDANASVPVDVQQAIQNYNGNASGNTAAPGNWYVQWAKGAVNQTAPVSGYKLKDRSTADALCSQSFGSGWRMAEFHDGWGWNFWAYDKGSLSNSSGKFWVAIDDQKANPWDF